MAVEGGGECRPRLMRVIEMQRRSIYQEPERYFPRWLHELTRPEKSNFHPKPCDRSEWFFKRTTLKIRIRKGNSKWNEIFRTANVANSRLLKFVLSHWEICYGDVSRSWYENIIEKSKSSLKIRYSWILIFVYRNHVYRGLTCSI